MKLVVFGLSVTSSWGNGHATLWRGLIRALARHGHRVSFFERDTPYYARHRDLTDLEGRARLVLYRDWGAASRAARAELADADVGMLTSYCPDAAAAAELLLEAPVPVRAFYDLDSGVTLERLRAGEEVAYLPPTGLGIFDVVLTYTGGRTLDEYRASLGARRVAPLYGSVDPDVHRPAAPRPDAACDLSYLGTWAADRQQALEALFLAPARRRPDRRFLIAGPQYPADFPWRDNIFYIEHVPPPEHPAFYCASPLTLNITRGAMARVGHCPSGRLFEAAACGVPVLSDAWDGLEQFFEPGREILVARTTGEALAALDRPREDLARIGARARDRVLGEHTAEHRARELVELLDGARTAPPGGR